MHSLWRVFDKKGMTEMSKLSIPVGISNFEKIRNGGFYYIDKTGLIAELVRSSAEVTLITRPRRFGKTLGIVLPGFVMWVLGVVFKVPFTNMTGISVLIAYAVFNVAIYKAANKGQKICLKMVIDGLKKYAKYEIIFYIIFLFNFSNTPTIPCSVLR